MSMKLVSECLEYGRQFLARHTLRNIVNMPNMDRDDKLDLVSELVEELKVTASERALMYGIFYTWENYCEGPTTGAESMLRILEREYVEARSVHRDFHEDPFQHCYWLDGTLTPSGKQLWMETRKRRESDSHVG